MQQLKERFDEDRAELEAHIAERVQAYIELGETPEQALISAREKFGETEVVMRELHRQKAVRSPITSGLLCAVSYLLITYLIKRAGIDWALWGNLTFAVLYALHIGRVSRTGRAKAK